MAEEPPSKRRRVDDYKDRLRQLVVLQHSFARDFLHRLHSDLTISILLSLTDVELRVVASVSKDWRHAIRACNTSARLVRAVAHRNWSAGLTTVVSLGCEQGADRFPSSWCIVLSDPHEAVHWWLAVAARPTAQQQPNTASPVCLYRRSIFSPPTAGAQLVGHVPASTVYAAAARPHCNQLVTLSMEDSDLSERAGDTRVRVWRMMPRDQPAAWTQEATWLLKDVHAVNDCSLPLLQDSTETDACLVVVTHINAVHVYTSHGVKLVHIRLVCPLGQTYHVYADSARMLPGPTEKKTSTDKRTSSTNKKKKRRLQVSAGDGAYFSARSTAVVVVDLPDSSGVGPTGVSISSLSDSLYALANGKSEYYWTLDLSSGRAVLVDTHHLAHRAASTVIRELAERKCAIAAPAQSADTVLCWDALRDGDGWRPRPAPAVVGVYHYAQPTDSVQQVTARDLFVVESGGDYKAPRRATLHTLNRRPVDGRDGSAGPPQRPVVQRDALALVDAVGICRDHEWAVFATTASTAGIIECGPAAWVLRRWATGGAHGSHAQRLPDVHVSKPPAGLAEQGKFELNCVASDTGLFLLFDRSFDTSGWQAGDQVQENCCAALLHVLPVVPLLYG